MIAFDANQQAVVDSDAIGIDWLFDVTDIVPTTYYRSTAAVSYGGHSYTFGIVDFDGISMSRNGSETDTYVPNELEFSILNKDNTLTASNFIGGSVLVTLVGANLHGVGTKYTLRQWKFKVRKAEGEYQRIRISCEDFLQQYLRGSYPNTPEAKYLFPSDDIVDDSLCVPLPFGTCYVPLRSVLSGGSRYYLLGPADKTYTITEVRSPHGVEPKVAWGATYTFTQSNKTGADSVSYKVFQPIIADADKNGTPDAVGLWKEGDGYLDMPCKFSRSDTSSITSPADVIEFVLKDMGVAAGDIDTAGTFASAKTTWSGWGLTWNGAFYAKQDRASALAMLLNMCHGRIVVRDKVYLYVQSKTSQMTISKSYVLGAEAGEGTFRSAATITDNKYADCGYVAWQEAGEPQDVLVRTLVTAKSSATKISGETMLSPWVQASQSAQKLGMLWLQKILLEKGELSFDGLPKCLALEPDDVITVNEADYGGTYTAYVRQVYYRRDLAVSIQAVTTTAALDDWGDLAPGAVTVNDDGSTDFWAPVYAGPGSDSTKLPNVIPGILRIGAGSSYVLIDPDGPYVRSGDYVTGVMGSGFTLQPDLLEVGNIACRGIFRTVAFQKSVLSAVAGSLGVFPNADVLDADMTAADDSSMTVKGTATFAVGDILRIKDGMDDEWLEVASQTSRKVGTNEAILSYGTGKQVTLGSVWEEATDITLTSGFHKMTVSGKSGTFGAFENVSFSPSGADMTYMGENGSTMYFKAVSGTPTTADSIAGDTSGATADIDTIESTNAGISPVLEIWGNSYNDLIWLAGAGTNEYYFRIVRPAAGNFLNTGAISTKHFVTTSYNNVIVINESYSEAQDIVAQLTRNTASDCAAFYTAYDVTDCGFAGCVAADCGNSGSGRCDGIYQYTYNNASYFVYTKNCLAFGCKSDGILLQAATNAHCYAYNDTSVGNGGYGFSGNTEQYCLCYGCGAKGNTSGQFESGANGVGQVNCSSSSPTFVDESGDNYHLASGDTAWKGADTNTGSWHSSVTYADDVDKQSRPPSGGGNWDIGFDQQTGYSGVIYKVTRDKAAAYSSGSNPAWKKGTAVVNYGQSGDGAVYMTASDTGAPFLSVLTHAGSPWSAITTHLRLGNLNGYAGYSSDIYGFSAYVDANNYVKIDPTNGLRIATDKPTALSVYGGGAIAIYSDAGTTQVLRLGDLNGYAGYTSAAYGMAAYIDANNYIKVDSTNGLQIATNKATALTLKSGASIKLETGGDILFYSAAGNQSRIVMYGNSMTYYMGIDYDINRLCMYPSSATDSLLGIGMDFANAVAAFDVVLVVGNTVHLGNADDSLHMIIDGDSGGSGDIVFATGSGASVRPTSHKVTHLGEEATAWDDAWADDWNNVADFAFMDEVDDLAIVRAIQKHPTSVSDKTGLPLIDDSTLDPMIINKKDGKPQVDPEGRPWVANNTMFGLLLGAIRQLDALMTIANTRLGALEARSGDGR